MSFTPLNTITSALRSIGVLATAEIPDANTANDCFSLLNEMLDQWSNEHLLVFTQQEVIQELTGGQFVYTIGPGGSVGASFTGSISGNVLTVTALASGAISAGQVVGGTGITAGTAITSLGTALGGNGANAIGTYYINLAYPGGISSEPMTCYAPRPLRLTSAFVRVVNSATGTLDYPVAVLAYEEYQSIGIKTLPGPWPRGVYLQPTEPLGILNYWPNPSQGEMHLFCDTVLNNFSTLYDTVTMPQGYQGALHWNLAELLMPEYGKMEPTQVQMVSKQAALGKRMVKRTNTHPQMPAFFDPALQQKARRDAGWILSGGQ